MKIELSKELKEICQKILDENKTITEWKKNESDDMFRTKSFVGGFDSTENAFCFSFYDEKGKEFWFQMTLEEIIKAAQGKISSIIIRNAE